MVASSDDGGGEGGRLYNDCYCNRCCLLLALLAVPLLSSV
jgi:hypothetical protein